MIRRSDIRFILITLPFVYYPAVQHTKSAANGDELGAIRRRMRWKLLENIYLSESTVDLICLRVDLTYKCPSNESSTGSQASITLNSKSLKCIFIFFNERENTLATGSSSYNRDWSCGQSRRNHQHLRIAVRYLPLLESNLNFRLQSSMNKIHQATWHLHVMLGWCGQYP